MPFDGFVMSTIARELETKVILGKIMKIYQPEPYTIILKIKNNTENRQLLISAHPVTGRIHLTEEIKENPYNPPMFCMVLRKHLEGGRITDIKQNGLDRVLNLIIEGYNDMGDRVQKTLSVEIMGKHSNIILIDNQDETILDGIKRYTHLVSRHREVLPGRPYLPPPSQDKEHPLFISEEKFRRLLLDFPLQKKVARALLQILAGVSPQLAKEIVHRADLTPDILIDDLGDYELIRLWQALEEILLHLRSDTYPGYVMLHGNEPIDFASLPLKHLTGLENLTYPSISGALDFYYAQKEKSNLFAARQRELIKIVNTEIERIEKKLALQEAKLLETDNMEELRLWGELITANIYKLTRGMTTAKLNNYYTPGNTVQVDLDPSRTPTENAQYYFKKYNKAKSAQILVSRQIAKNQEELHYLLSILNSLEQGEELEDLREIRRELVSAAYVKNKSTKGKNQPKKTETNKPAPPLKFQSSENFTILVGRNNRQNDSLTLRLAQKDDLWLHTKNIPGSHVIIRGKPGQAGHHIPMNTITEAAKLAAYYSKARASANVPVDYTLVSQVKKPRGARPGMVIYFEQKTIYVTPDKSNK